MQTTNSWTLQTTNSWTFQVTYPHCEGFEEPNKPILYAGRWDDRTLAGLAARDWLELMLERDNINYIIQLVQVEEVKLIEDMNNANN